MNVKEVMKCVLSELLNYLKEDLGYIRSDVEVSDMIIELKSSYFKCDELRGRGRPRKTKLLSSVVSNEDKIGKLLSQVEESEEESIKVKKLIINSITYLISEKNEIYDFESHDLIGSYINETLILN